MTSSTIAINTPGARGFTRRENGALAAVVCAHFVSHIYYLVLPPLFPLLREKFGLGFVELGFALTVFNGVTFLLQMPVGFLVDRVGPRAVLAAGLLLGGASFIAIGLHPTYTTILIAMAVGGLANCAYHPADYSMMAGTVAGPRIGRAFSLHLFAGYIGTAIAPALMLLYATTFGLSGAFIAAGLMAPVAALALLFAPSDTQAASASVTGDIGAPVRIFTPLIVALTGFFALFSLSMTGINNFSVAALVEGTGLSLGFATTILTACLTMSALGVLAGGLLADRTAHHGAVATAGFAMTATLMATVAFVPMSGWAILFVLAVAGFLSGMIQPSRDMIVRAACPPGAAGRVFGVVTTGFNMGAASGPLIFGAALDHGHPMSVFGITALVMIVTAGASVLAGRATTRGLR